MIILQSCLSTRDFISEPLDKDMWSEKPALSPIGLSNEPRAWFHCAPPAPSCLMSSFNKNGGGCGPQLESQVLKTPDGTLCVLYSFPVTTTGHHPVAPALQRTLKKGSRLCCLGALEGSGSYLNVLPDQAWVQDKVPDTKADPAGCCTGLQSQQTDFRREKAVPREEELWSQMVYSHSSRSAPEPEAIPLGSTLEDSVFFIFCLSFNFYSLYCWEGRLSPQWLIPQLTYRH